MYIIRRMNYTQLMAVSTPTSILFTVPFRLPANCLCATRKRIVRNQKNHRNQEEEAHLSATGNCLNLTIGWHMANFTGNGKNSTIPLMEKLKLAAGLK